MSGDDLKTDAQACLAELRLMSSALTTQVLALLPTQAALVVGFALAEKKSDIGSGYAVWAIASLGLAVMCSVYTLIRVHDRVIWEHDQDDAAIKKFVKAEAQRVAAKGEWSRIGVATTLIAAVAVIVCNLVPFIR